MAQSALKLTGVTFTNLNLPKLEKDIIIPAAGALWLFDGANPDSVPLSLAVGGTWRNLVRTQPDAVIKNLPVPSVTGGGLVFDGSGVGSFLDAGTTYNLTAKQLVFCGLFKAILPFAGYSEVMGRGSSGGGSSQFQFGTESSGAATFGGAIQTTGGLISPASGFGTAVNNAIYHIAMSCTFVGNVTTQQLYLNGALISTNAVAGTGLLAPPTTANIGIGRYDGLGAVSPFKGTIYRLYAEDLGISGRSVAQVVAADYAVASTVGRYS